MYICGKNGFEMDRRALQQKGVLQKMKLYVKIWRNDSGEYVAACPSLPGCITTGRTSEEAKERLEDAIRGYLASVNKFVPARLHEMLEYSNSQ